MSVVVYSKDQCMQCKMVKKHLELNHVEFVEKNIDHDTEAFEFLKSHEFKSVPVTIVDDNVDEAIRGFDINAIRKLSQS